MNDISITNRDRDNHRTLGDRDRAAVNKRAEAKLALEIILCTKMGAIMLVSVLGVGDLLSLAQCALAWIAIITGAQIARGLVKINYLRGT